MSEYGTSPCILKLYGNGYPDMLVDELGFSWKVDGTAGMQKSYRLTISKADGTPVWDTGTVRSGCSAGIVYEGPALESNTAYTASVTVEAEDGTVYSSDEVPFSTGFMSGE